MWLSTPLGDIGVAGCGEIGLEGRECEICICSLLGGSGCTGGCLARVPHYCYMGDLYVQSRGYCDPDLVVGHIGLGLVGYACSSLLLLVPFA